MNAINLNSTILSNYQKNFPNLADFSYDEEHDCLIYLGNPIYLNGYGLSRIDSIFFNLAPNDIYAYLKNGFYQNTDLNGQIQNLINKTFLTEEEISFVKNYVNKFSERYNIYANNQELFNQNRSMDSPNSSLLKFETDMSIARDIIENSIKIKKAQIANNTCETIADEYANLTKRNNQSMNEYKGMVLTRTKNPNGYTDVFKSNEDYLKRLQEQDNPKMGMAGFTSIILLISSAITFGMYLATVLLK